MIQQSFAARHGAVLAPSAPVGVSRPWLDAAAQPYVRIEGVTKRFGPATAVDNVSLSIYRGEFFALLGPSGCGKTTLLRMLAGFETPDEGRILIDGADMATVPPYERPVNMMFQSYALFPHMTVEGNVAYGLKQEGGVPRAEIRDRVAAMLDLVEMRQFAGRKPHQLSGGQRQRVALARALVKQPKLLLLDEPLAALDRKLRERTQFELVRIQERVGITFVIVTHDQEEAMTMASRLAVMEKGRVRQLGTPAEVYETPSSRFVADFIGSVNLFSGRVAALHDGGGLVDVAVPDLGGVDARIAVASDKGVALDADVAVAVRPEKIALSRAVDVTGAVAAGQGALNRFAGTVSEIGYLGQVSVVHIELPNGTVLRASVANAHRLSEPPFARGDAVVLSFAPESAVLLTE